MNEKITIELLDPTTLPSLDLESRLDGYQAPGATHVFLKAGRIVGAAALFAPAVTFWAHTKRLTKREALTLARLVAEAAKTKPRCLVACEMTSPFHKYMHRFGFQNLGLADWFTPL